MGEGKRDQVSTDGTNLVEFRKKSRKFGWEGAKSLKLSRAVLLYTTNKKQNHGLMWAALVENFGRHI